MHGKLEVRSLRVRPLRAEKRDGKDFLSGQVAPYNVLSGDFGGWRERIMPGAFARAVAEAQDVRHTKNHDKNLVLGRTKSGTTVLTDCADGLKFETCLPDTSYARDLAVSVERGDIDENSFAFFARKQKWVQENGIDVRELHDVDLVDISTVTYPAYPETSARLDQRSMFPHGVPAEIRSRIPNAGAEPCECDCQNCLDGKCNECTNAECTDPNCQDCPMQTDASAEVPAAVVAESRSRVCAFVRSRPAAAQERKFRAALRTDGTLELMIYEDIGEDWWSGGGVTAKLIKQQLDAAGNYASVCLRVNSGGGDCFEGITIHNLLRSQGKPVKCCVDGLAASAASIIAMCGDTIEMASSGMMMIHNVATMEYGDAQVMRKTADMLDKISGSAAQTYVDRTKLSMDTVRGLMDAETWMSAQDCLDQGFCTAITPPPTSPDEQDEEERAAAAIRQSPLLRTYRNVPERFRPIEQHAADATAERRQRLRLMQAI